MSYTDSSRFLDGSHNPTKRNSSRRPLEPDNKWQRKWKYQKQRIENIIENLSKDQVMRALRAAVKEAQEEDGHTWAFPEHVTLKILRGYDQRVVRRASRKKHAPPEDLLNAVKKQLNRMANGKVERMKRPRSTKKSRNRELVDVYRHAKKGGWEKG